MKKRADSHGILNFFVAVCMLELGLNGMPTLFDFPAVLAVIAPVCIIEMPVCSMSHELVHVNLPAR